MATVLLLTAAGGSVERVMPAFALLPHRVRLAPLTPAALVEAMDADVIVLDARTDLVAARSLCQLTRTLETPPVLLVVTEGGWSVVGASWGATDVVVDTAGPAEVDARVRMAVERAQESTAPAPETVEAGDLLIDPAAYTARLRGHALDLTYKEFELLRHLAANPGRVFTRAQLLQEVWGYDYFGGTRTVDVHVRRLRAKLGVEYDQLIGTVRNVGYRFNPDSSPTADSPAEA
ncbi:MAG: response regulator transcription factor [Actinomycetes bacterium]|nr:response regulator transcription factor [Actinomycetes bacterium]MDX5380540.1 response regulator transcription factor [Actinomycetes bacterium]MDX5399427.1 response regulator transcription factor [Actinomycetes bacterium]MDX5450280.1 response regulator transcription factor [Actinomycetes bacterium]